jgi:hypothetical protein
MKIFFFLSIKVPIKLWIMFVVLEAKYLPPWETRLFEIVCRYSEIYLPKKKEHSEKTDK